MENPLKTKGIFEGKILDLGLDCKQVGDNPRVNAFQCEFKRGEDKFTVNFNPNSILITPKAVALEGGKSIIPPIKYIDLVGEWKGGEL